MIQILFTNCSYKYFEKQNIVMFTNNELQFTPELIIWTTIWKIYKADLFYKTYEIKKFNYTTKC